MKILITGGHGFIGTHFWNVMNTRHDIGRYDIKTGYDILNTEILEYVIKNNGYDLVVHMAAMTAVDECIKQPRKAFNTNVLGTYNVGLLCAKYDVPMLHVSTVAVYGNQDGITTEETKPNCCEPYACSKLAAENLLRGISGLKLNIARLGTVFGVNMRPELFSYIAFDSIINGKTIHVDGDGKQNRLMVYIDDVIRGLIRISNLNTYGETYNLCGKNKVSAIDTLSVASEIVGKRAPVSFRKQRQGQVFDENISIKRAWDFLSWKPKTSFEDGMAYIYAKDKRFNS